jgi:hypothetical protein
MTNEIEDPKRDSARLAWLIKEALDEARRGAKSIPLTRLESKLIEILFEEFERARWCEENAATVAWLGRAWACHYKRGDGRVFGWYHEERNTAIDRARGVVK